MELKIHLDEILSFRAVFDYILTFPFMRDKILHCCRMILLDACGATHNTHIYCTIFNKLLDEILGSWMLVLYAQRQTNKQRTMMMQTTHFLCWNCLDIRICDILHGASKREELFDATPI